MKDSTMIVLGLIVVICALCSAGYGHYLRRCVWKGGSTLRDDFFLKALGYQALVVGVVLLLIGFLNGRHEAVRDACSLFGLSC